jgi:hypothetical protein
MERRVIPMGTIVLFGGFPVQLVADAEVQTHPDNWKAIYDLNNVAQPQVNISDVTEGVKATVTPNTSVHPNT